ncbi:MAG: PH domain-containing protein [Persicimonas sp.]
MDEADEANEREIRPLWRPFVLRPALHACVPVLIVVAVAYFFWSPLEGFLGPFAWGIPALAALFTLGVLLERIVRYRKTVYRLGPGGLVVRTGSFFTERTVELELENITLVEWRSPFFLRRLYDVGHITAQEAGSAAQNARMAYIEGPQEVYERVAELMRERGFSMSRDVQVRCEEPGVLGALVDLAAAGLAFVSVIVGFAFSGILDLWTVFAGDSGATIWDLVRANYAAFEGAPLGRQVLEQARQGFLVLGGAMALLVSSTAAMMFVDLLRRTYTLFDDVIDYYDGFFNETRRFIPLENLADTRVSRPIHKRVLGLTDVRLSARGAGSEIVFQSMPNGAAFASALDGLLEGTQRPVSAGEGMSLSADQPDKPARPTRRLKPVPMRAALSGALGAIPAALLLLAAPLAIIAFGGTFEIGSLAIASVSILFVIGAIIFGVVALIGITQRVIRAVRTEYSFDDRRVGETFDFLSSHETRFKVDQITSMSVLRNPLDAIMGTATVRFRSIGSGESIDFAHIAAEEHLIEAMRRALGLHGGGFTTSSRGSLPEQLEPTCSPLDALKAGAPFVGALVGVWGLAIAANLAFDVAQISAAIVGVTGVGAVGYLLWRDLYHRRLRGQLLGDYVEVTGGVIRRFRHLAAYRDIKVVESLLYPAGEQGRLTLVTGGGFQIRVGHLPEPIAVHDGLDARLLDSSEPLDARPRATYRPHPATEVFRHSGRMLRILVGAPFLVLTAPWVYLLFRRARYRIEGSRILSQIGLIYARRTTVLFDRVDHLETSRTFANSLFGNSDIEVFTVGSGEADLVLRSVAEAERALGLLRGEEGV